jgi:hypothetical protein
MDDFDYEAQVYAAEREAPYPRRLRLWLAVIRLVGAIAQRFGLAVIVALILMALPHVASADPGHYYVTPQVKVVLGGNAPGTIYCPTGLCGKMYAYTRSSNTVTILRDGAQPTLLTTFRPSAKLNYVTRNVYAEAEAAGANPIQAASAARGYSSLGAARAAVQRWSIGAGGGGVEQGR